MSLDAVKIIRDAEAKGEEIRKDALVKARELVRQAEQEGADAVEAALRNAQKTGEGKMEQARVDAQAQIDALTAENEEECRRLKEQAEGKLQEAAAFIMGRIVKSHGHR